MQNISTWTLRNPRKVAKRIVMRWRKFTFSLGSFLGYISSSGWLGLSFSWFGGFLNLAFCCCWFFSFWLFSSLWLFCLSRFLRNEKRRDNAISQVYESSQLLTCFLMVVRLCAILVFSCHIVSKALHSCTVHTIMSQKINLIPFDRFTYCLIEPYVN